MNYGTEERTLEKCHDLLSGAESEAVYKDAERRSENLNTEALRCLKEATSRFSQADFGILTFSRQVTVEDFEVVCTGLYRALCIREKYMQKSFQRFPKTPSKYLRNIDGQAWVANENFYPGNLFPYKMYRKYLLVLELKNKFKTCPYIISKIRVILLL